MPSGPHTKAGSTRKSSRSPPSRSHRRLSHSLRSSTRAELPRVVLGHDAIASLPTELNKLCLSQPVVVYSPSRLLLANRIRALLPNLDACFTTSDMLPDPMVLSGRDSVISVGGPMAVTMARRISLKMGIPHICVPTMHSGAAGDLSPWGQQEEDHESLATLEEGSDERSDNGARSLPAVIIYDKRLTESRIKRFPAPSGVCGDKETEPDADVALVVAPGITSDADVPILRSVQSSTAQWSYINLPGV